MRSLKHLAHGHIDEDWQSQDSESVLADVNPYYSYHPLFSPKRDGFAVTISFSISSFSSPLPVSIQSFFVRSFTLIKDTKANVSRQVLCHHISSHNQSQQWACSFLAHFVQHNFLLSLSPVICTQVLLKYFKKQ